MVTGLPASGSVHCGSAQTVAVITSPYVPAPMLPALMATALYASNVGPVKLPVMSPPSPPKDSPVMRPAVGPDGAVVPVTEVVDPATLSCDSAVPTYGLE